MDMQAFDGYLAVAQGANNIEVTAPVLGYYPYTDVISKATSMSAAYRATVTDTDANGLATVHTVVCAFYKLNGHAEIVLWCGDKFLEGRLPGAEAQSRCEEAALHLVGSAKKRVIAQLLKGYDQFPESAKCSFWNSWRRDKKLCAHTNAFLALLRDTVPKFKETLETAYSEAMGGVTVTGASSDTMGLEELAFRVPVLFEGERGAGKTVTARAFARDNKFKCVELGGHEGIESPDLLGFLVPIDRNSMVWKDGPLAEAMRAAKTQKTVLIIDELLRIRQRELSILLTMLSPDEGVYRLRTGRIKSVEDGVAIEEVLECPVENLCVVATTNVGSEYAVDDIDPALADRFVILRKDTTVSELKKILAIVAKQYSMPESVAAQCLDFFQRMQKARENGLVKNTPNTRTLARAISLAIVPGDVKRAVKTQILLWVGRTGEGYPIPEQIADVEDIIDRCFK